MGFYTYLLTLMIFDDHFYALENHVDKEHRALG